MTSLARVRPCLCLTKYLIFGFIIFSLLISCSTDKPLLKENPKSQRYFDETRKYFSKIPQRVSQAAFGYVNFDPQVDLLILNKNKSTPHQVKTYIHHPQKKLVPHFKNGLDRNLQFQISSMAFGDLNGDRLGDLMVLGRLGSKPAVQMLIKNRKGYFYLPRHNFFQGIKSGVNRMQLMDIDHDGDLDVLFFGKALKKRNGKPASSNVQLFINKGKGQFENTTSLLLPAIPERVIGVSRADYDGDKVSDLFIISESGKNMILINNGLGKLTDATDYSLPHIPAKYTHADWADFDLDGDNDILLTTHGISKKYRNYSREYSFFLENDGQAHFKKRSLNILPHFPAHRVYLLDADGNEWPDILILSKKRVHFLVGRGDWKFADESIKRLPYSVPFDEMIFDDINGDSYLDIFGILSKNKTGRIWISHVK